MCVRPPMICLYGINNYICYILYGYYTHSFHNVALVHDFLLFISALIHTTALYTTARASIIFERVLRWVRGEGGRDILCTDCACGIRSYEYECDVGLPRGILQT